MAWWKKPAASLTPPVTVDRIAGWFDDNELAYDRHESGEAVISGFGEYSYFVAIPEPTLLQIRGQFYADLPNDDVTLARLRSVINDVNSNQVFPTLSTSEAEGKLNVVADIVASITEGLNDEQLVDLLETSTRIILSTFDSVGETLGIEPKDGGDE